jgi:hypothetical protein
VGALAELFCLVYEVLAGAVQKRCRGEPGCLALLLTLAAAGGISLLLLQLIVWLARW